MKDVAEQVREWLDTLRLSDQEGAEALGLGNPDVIMREYKNPKKDRQPAPTTLRFMELTLRMVEALALLRTGQTHKAKVTLETMMTPALLRASETWGQPRLVALKAETPPGG